MDPVTISFNGLNEFLTQFGPFGYLIGHMIAAAFFGFLSWRNIAAAGACHGAASGIGDTDDQRFHHKKKMEGNSHIARSITSGIVGLGNLVIVIVISMNLFLQSFEMAKGN